MNNRALQKNALILVWVGELWNAIEVAVAFWSGINANSVALLAFGLDSLIELFAGGVLIWRLSSSWGKKEFISEKKAVRLVGMSFYALAVYIIFHSSLALFGFLPRPEGSLVGIILIVASAAFMTVLFFKKTKLAKSLNSPALAAEAKQSLFCDLQDLTVIVGLGANFLFGWWWADAIVALALVPLIIKEGKESLSEEHHGH